LWSLREVRAEAAGDCVVEPLADSLVAEPMAVVAMILLH
jgi:hypothetical protein